MTDFAIERPREMSAAEAAAAKRVRARYRAEARFRFYGLAAIAITAMFLVAVLTDIVGKGLPAFTMHQLVMDIKVDPAEIDPQNTRDPAVIRNGNFDTLTRNALRAIFPEAKDRTSRRQLDGLLSSGAADELRSRVASDPSLLGQTVKVPVLLSDDADLYLKGIGTQILSRDGQGTATLSSTEGAVELVTTSNDFAPDLIALKQSQSQRARELRTQSETFRRQLVAIQERKSKTDGELAAARTANDTARITTLERSANSMAEDIASLSKRVAELDAQASELQARFDATDAAQPLGQNQGSILVAINGGVVKVTELGNTRIKGDVLIAPASTNDAARGQWKILNYPTPEGNRRVSDREVSWLENLRAKGIVENAFNWRFFTAGDSREAELAGIRGALIGSTLTLLVTLIVCLPLGVAAAIYLEEFAVKNRLTEIIEVNINNLAAVPSIVFGLLGLAVFLNFFGLPRSAPLVGGLVLALLVLPTIIIAARAALKAVPPSIKEAALGVGASHQQAVFHHVLPLAVPGILTGTIIGMAHALGETAPLLMIGMVAFIVESPKAVTDAATVLPVQIFLWSDLPEIAFQAKTAAAIMVLLAFLFVMNGTAIYLRKKFERRW
jgi:phosphate transport system permease protein